MNLSFRTHSERETIQRAKLLGQKLRPGTVVALAGEMGSGKTHFIKGLCQGFGVKDADEVKSPTFVLLHQYQGRFPIYHFDLYRLEQERELEPIGFDEFLSDPKAVAVVEWADRVPTKIPREAVWVELKILGPTSRQIRVRGHSR